MANDETEDIIDPVTNNDEAEEVEETEEETPEESTGQAEEVKEEKPKETPEAKRARLKRQLEQLDKKHGFKDEPAPKKEEPQGDTLSHKDTMALINSKVHEDDVDEVIEYAKFKKISVAEALKSGVIKSSLAEKAEQRQTAEATTVGRTRSAAASRSGESLLTKAQQKGELPDSDEDLNKLLDSRYDGMTRKK